jgi:hypothetical protein
MLGARSKLLPTTVSPPLIPIDFGENQGWHLIGVLDVLISSIRARFRRLRRSDQRLLSPG